MVLNVLNVVVLKFSSPVYLHGRIGSSLLLNVDGNMRGFKMFVVKEKFIMLELLLLAAGCILSWCLHSSL